jgi:cytochrome c556
VPAPPNRERAYNRRVVTKQTPGVLFLLVILLAILCAPTAPAQTPTMKQLMLDLIHPASNDIPLIVSRGGPSDEKEWASVRHSALALAESGSALMAQGQSGSGTRVEAWMKAAKLLADAGGDAYKAAQAKDVKALAGVTIRIDVSCTNCHKQYRPNVFPQGGSK